MINAALKQRILIGLGLFLSLSAIGFSFREGQVRWFWQRLPFAAFLLMVLTYLLIQQWLRLEVERQKELIRTAFQSGQQHPRDELYRLLSTREREVLELVLQGKSNKEIADTLFVALSTVKTHINNIYKIAEVKNRREAKEKFG